MLYSLKITSGACDPIEIGKDNVEEEKTIITDVIIKLDTIDDNVFQKSNAIQAKIEVHGQIDDKIKKELLAMFNWAKEAEQDKWYRTVEVKIKTSEKDIYRTYVFENMFVVDYFEIHKSDGNNGENPPDEHFELYMTQKKDNLKLIDSFL